MTVNLLGNVFSSHLSVLLLLCQIIAASTYVYLG
jgi:hypothetical protein